MTKTIYLAVAALVCGCAPMTSGDAPVTAGHAPTSVSAPQDVALDALAARYVTLQLAIGAQEDGYIDAYYGPASWRDAAEADPAGKPDLLARTIALRAAINAAAPKDAVGRRRATWLAAQLTAAQTRLRMMMGEKLSFQDEAEGLFGVMQSGDVALRYGRKTYGPYPALPENIRMRLLSEC